MVLLDKTFANEIKKVANGDGSREARLSFIKTLREVKSTLSTPKAASLFDECIKTYGRVPVAVCTAVSIIDRADRLEGSSYRWALEVIKLWTNTPAGDKGFAIIRDGLHPSRIEEYAGSLMKVTTVPS